MGDTAPIFETLLDQANVRLKEYDNLICNIREVLDRIKMDNPKICESSNSKGDAPRETQNDITNRLAIFCTSFERSNNMLEGIYARLRELA